MDKFDKVTNGFVTQNYKRDEDGNFHCKSLNFCAGDVEYEDGFGDALLPDKHQEAVDKEVYQSFEMVQPNTEIVVTVQGGLIQEIIFPSGLNDVTVVVKDYDTDGDSEGLKKDSEGDEYRESRWNNLD